MKTKISLILAVLIISVSGVFAQPGNPNMQKQPGEPMILNVIPDLTQDQQDKIKNYHLEMLKTITPLQADMKAKQAELDALMIKDSDLKEKEAIVKQMQDIRYNIQMARIEYHDNVRSLLTDDQKVIYDNWYLKHRNGMHHKGKHNMMQKRGPQMK